MGFAPEVTILQAFAVDGFAEHGGGGCAVAGGVAGFAGDFAHHLGAHVFKGVFEFDFLGDSDTVFGHGRGAEFFVEHHVAALGPERGGDGPGEFGYTAQDRLACCLVEY